MSKTNRLDLRKLPVVIRDRVPSAPFRASYAEARRALAISETIDECKEWADKAAALATYAKEANDDELFAIALRVRARAYERAGLILVEIEGERGAEARLTDTQKRAAKQHGMSEEQAKKAKLIATMSPSVREPEIEGPRPPSVTKLAAIARGLLPRAAPDIEHTQHFDSLVRRPGGLISMVNFVKRFSPAASYASEFNALESEWMSEQLIVPLQEWLDEFEQHLNRSGRGKN